MNDDDDYDYDEEDYFYVKPQSCYICGESNSDRVLGTRVVCDECYSNHLLDYALLGDLW